MSSLGIFRTALVSSVALVAAAWGQVAPVSPAYFALVNADDAMMRCGSDDNFYPIAKLARGQLLRVDGEGGGWSRISYPAGTSAFIGADSFQPDATGKTGTVTKPNKLKALNLTTGLKGSWSPVLDTPIAAGTKLAIMDAEAMPDGRGSTAFRIVPPDNARAFVQTSALRKASNEEINAAMAAKPADSAKPEAAPANKPIAQGSTPAAPAAAQPQAPSITAGAPGSAPTWTAPKPEPTTPNTPTTTTAATPPPAPKPLPPSPYEKLDAAFEAVRKQPPETAEFSALISEIQAAMDKLDDSPSSAAIRRRLDQRLNYLKLSTDIQAQKRKMAESQATWSEHDRLIKQRMDDVARARQYTLVGRLSASSIYDGKRMPLMYRVQTVGGPAPRTLAYLKPDPKLGIDSKLGQVVGVVGDSVIDPTLHINILTPLRVDTLEPAEPPADAAPTSPPQADKPAADASDGK